MALSDYQFSYRGLTMGEGTVYDIIKMEGLHDLIVQSFDRDNPRSHGSVPGLNKAQFRLIRCTLFVRGTAGSTAHETAVQTLLDKMSPDQRELPQETLDQFAWKFPGEEEKYLYVRPTRRSRPRQSDTEGGLATVRFELKTYDPRAYGTETQDADKSGTFTVTNNGGATAYPHLNFNPAGGACRLVNNTTGDEVEMLSGGGSGAGLVFDMRRFVQGRGDLLIVYRGTTNLYNYWETPRMPFRLIPGGNLLSLSTGTAVTVTHDATWM
jgi:hypothetical protein